MDYRQEMQTLIDQLNAASAAYYNGRGKRKHMSLPRFPWQRQKIRPI